MKWSKNEWLDFETSIKMGCDLSQEKLLEAIEQYQLIEMDKNNIEVLKELIEDLKANQFDEKTALKNVFETRLYHVNEKYHELLTQVEALENGSLIEQYNRMKREHERILAKNLDLENKLKENERNEKGYKTMWAMINRKYNELEQQYYALKRQQV